MSENNKDLGVLTLFAEASPGIEQSDFLMTNEKVIANAVHSAIGAPKTRVFSNLCEEEQLKDWNIMQADKTIVILERKSLSVPANSSSVVDPLRITYREVDKEIFDLALILYAVKAGYDISEFAAAFLTDNMLKNIMKVLDGEDKLVGKLMSGLLTVFKKYPVALILKQKEMFIEKVDNLFSELEKEGFATKPGNKAIQQVVKSNKKGKTKRSSKGV